jgi:hypothetical protein
VPPNKEEEEEEEEKDSSWHANIVLLWDVLCCVMTQQEVFSRLWHHVLGLPSLQIHKSNKPLFFINYQVNGIQF